MVDAGVIEEFQYVGSVTELLELFEFDVPEAVAKAVEFEVDSKLGVILCVQGPVMPLDPNMVELEGTGNGGEVCPVTVTKLLPVPARPPVVFNPLWWAKDVRPDGAIFEEPTPVPAEPWTVEPVAVTFRLVGKGGP